MESPAISLSEISYFNVAPRKLPIRQSTYRSTICNHAHKKETTEDRKFLHTTVGILILATPR